MGKCTEFQDRVQSTTRILEKRLAVHSISHIGRLRLTILSMYLIEKSNRDNVAIKDSKWLSRVLLRL
jgi:hypothetical protein